MPEIRQLIYISAVQ